MATKVNVTSIEAIQNFRAHLILYINKARPALEEVSSELARVKYWVQDTQKSHWMGVLKKQGRVLEEARAAVFSAKLSNLKEAATAEQLALSKAKSAYDFAESKMRVIRRWDREFEHKTEPLAKQLEKVNTLVADDLTQAVQYLTEIVKLLDDYASGTAPGMEPKSDSAPSATPGADAESAAGEQEKEGAS